MTSRFTDWADVPLVLRPEDVMRVTGWSRATVYEKMTEERFPLCPRRPTERMYVTKDNLRRYLGEQEGT